MSSRDRQEIRAGTGGGWIPALALLATCVCVVLLAATGFHATLSGAPLGGWHLLGHVGVGGAFAVALAVLAICRTADFEPDRADVSARLLAPVVCRVGFWVMVAAGMCLILSSGLMMLPQFGTVGQEMLLVWHRYSAIVAVAASVIYGMVALANRKRS